MLKKITPYQKYDLDAYIRSFGCRGGTYFRENDVISIKKELYNPYNSVSENTLYAIKYVYDCQEKADAYDYTEYFDQMPKIMDLVNTITCILEKKRAIAI